MCFEVSKKRVVYATIVQGVAKQPPYFYNQTKIIVLGS